ncbi:CPBP family intramembrane metalloprotease [Pseudohalocynthiibacter aestuariivivens]|nr:CPBP family intramembrane glutamic endopeptidase [Pseudohalocynthiibacter aestuariivivens]QIE46635.1 CPBP family intramembrane metalloprotease [Pseudohalocynthiibacter aestuariivivens]
MKYEPHLHLIAPARGSHEIWRLLVGIVLIAALFLVMTMVYGSLCDLWLPDTAWGHDGRGLQDASTPWGTLANLYIFVLLIIATWATLLLLHTRQLRSLFGPPALALGQFRHVLIALILLTALIFALPAPDALTPERHLEWSVWLAFLLPALIGVTLQVSAEEILFRGYLQSQLAARFSHPALWMGLPTALFAALHYAPSQTGDNAWIVVLWAGLFGLAAADLTARSGTLGPAIALHLINNVSALLLVAPAGVFDGLALYSYPFGMDDTDIIRTWLPVDLMLLLCSWLAARLALRV